MTYKELEELTKGMTFPVVGKTEDDERVIIECGWSDGGRFFRLTVAQYNDWYRIVTIWEDGTREETYAK